MTKNRPKPIIWFERLFFASLLVTVVDLFVHRDIMLVETGSDILIEIIVLGLLLFGVPLLLWFFITDRASALARSIYTLFCVFGIFGIFFMFDEYSTSEIIFTVTTQSLVLASTVFLFRPAADIWFLSGGQRTGDEEDELADVFK